MGTIFIKKRLTRRSVTPSVSVYQRGTSVKLGGATDQDPIAFERSRVVIYLEGSVAGNPELVAPSAAVEIQQINRQFVPRHFSDALATRASRTCSASFQIRVAESFVDLPLPQTTASRAARQSRAILAVSTPASGRSQNRDQNWRRSPVILTIRSKAAGTSPS